MNKIKKNIICTLLSGSALIGNSQISLATPLTISNNTETDKAANFDSVNFDGNATWTINNSAVVVDSKVVTTNTVNQGNILFQGTSSLDARIGSNNPLSSVQVDAKADATNTVPGTPASTTIFNAGTLSIGEDATFTFSFEGSNSSNVINTNIEGSDGSGDLNIINQGTSGMIFEGDIGVEGDPTKKLDKLNIQDTQETSSSITFSKPNLYIDANQITTTNKLATLNFNNASGNTGEKKVKAQIGSSDSTFYAIESNGSLTLHNKVFLSDVTLEINGANDDALVLTTDTPNDALTLHDQVISNNKYAHLRVAGPSRNLVLANTQPVEHNIGFGVYGFLYFDNFDLDIEVAGSDVTILKNTYVKTINYTSTSEAKLKLHYFNDPLDVASLGIPGYNDSITSLSIATITSTGDRIHSLEIVGDDINFTGSFGSSSNHMKDMIIDGEGGHSLTISTNNFFGSVGTNQDNTGTVILNSSNLALDNAGYPSARLATLRTSSDASIGSISAVNVEMTGAAHTLTTSNGNIGGSIITSSGYKIHSLAVVGNDNIDFQGSFGSQSNPMKSLIVDGISNHTFTLSTNDYFGGIETNQAGAGNVILNSSGANISGLGQSAAPVGNVRFDESATIEDGSYAQNMSVAAGKTASFEGGNVVGNNLLLEGNNSVASFNNVSVLDMEITAQNAGEGIVNFSGGISIEKEIGTQDKPVAEVNFVAIESEIYDVKSDIHATLANLNGVTVFASAGASGAIVFDSKILAEGSKFVIDSGTRLRFDPNDVVISKISDSTFDFAISDTGNSSIEISRPVVFENGVSFKFTDTAALPGSEGDRVQIIEGSLDVQGEEGITLVDELRPFVEHRMEDNDVVRTNVAVEKMTEIAPENTSEDEIEIIFNPDNTGDAQALAADVEQVLANEGETAAKSLTDNVSGVAYPADHSIHEQTSGAMGDRSRMVVAAIGASDDQDLKFGFWTSPFFSIATQKTDGNYSGYLMRSFGGIFGVDTMINDRTMIGASIGIGSDHASYKDAKKGSVASINNMIYSLYGSYSFGSNWLVAGNIAVSVDKVTITEPRGGSGGSPARTKYSSLQYNAETTGGYDFKLSEKLTITPIAGYLYSYRTKIDYQQSGANAGNLRHQTKALRRHEAIYGVRATHKMKLGDMDLENTFSARGRYNFGSNVVESDSQIPGTVSPLPKRYITLPRHRLLAGMESKIQKGRFEYSVKYDFMHYNKYTSHTGSLKIKINL